jgi:His-Xaa-Ser system protein HxsD
MDRSVMSDENAQAIKICFQTDLYRIKAIQKAAYRFAGKCYVSVETIAPGQARAVLRPKERLVDPAQLEGEFRNEVLDQELREQIAEETMPVRNLLLAQAFSSLTLADAEADDGDYLQDPKGISRADGGMSVEAP